MHPVQRHTLDFDLVERPASLNEALVVLDRHGAGARPIAGGTDLLLELQRGVRRSVDTLVDLSAIPGLDSISIHADRIRIGPLVTHADIVRSETVREHALPLAQASWEIGSPQLRNRATVVGNLVTASPANDTITPLRVLDAELEITSLRGARTMRLSDFHTGVRRTTLDPGEMVTAVTFRTLAPQERGVFLKLGNRRAQAISVVHLAATLSLESDIVRGVRLALGSVAPTVVEADTSEVVGSRLDDVTIERLVEAAAAVADPIDDVRATGEYRSAAIQVMVRRAFAALAAGEPSRLPDRPVTLGAGHRHATAAMAQRTTPTGISVNGQAFSAPAGTSTLLDWLRSVTGLTGTKEGCAEGECGACTVILNGAAVMSCLVLAAQAEGSAVTTVEGLAEGDTLHGLQQAFVDSNAVQCGFCTPGFLMSGAKLLEEGNTPSRSDIETALSGNLCRCTGYYSIIQAIELAAERARA